MIDYTTLNPEQREAVFSDRKRILCLAGAGTGKTQVLTRRVARLWEAGSSPANMLALTFTRAAGAEMKERVIGLIGNDGKRIFSNTFHAFCVEVIREFADRLGYEPNFSVYDAQESEELAAEVLTDLSLKMPVKRLTEAREGKYEGMPLHMRNQAQRALKEYRFRLRRNNALDFDGLIETVREALTDPAILDTLRERYKYVFVDEFQDTDPAQWEIVTKLNPINLFVVGDDFQSIYGFRGSDISIILGLAQDGAWQTVKLERNYRSTQPIINAANALIKHNTQTEKSLTTDKQGAEIDLREPENDETEIADIAERLLDGVRTTAILARTNKQLDRAKAILTAHGVPCETNASADSPLSSRGGKLLLAWIAAIENPQDDAAIRKIAAHEMSRAGFIDTEKIQLAGTGSFLDAMRGTDEGVAVLQLYGATRAAFHNAEDIIEGVAVLQSAHGLNDWGAAMQIANWKERQQAIDEPTTAAALLEWVRLCNVAERPTKERGADKVHLMTVHGSKGLEFDNVYIIGAAQGAFPNRGNLEEERRLFYVAITRAREYLNISRPRTMTDWNGHAQPTERSQFIAEAMNT